MTYPEVAQRPPGATDDHQDCTAERWTAPGNTAVDGIRRHYYNTHINAARLAATHACDRGRHRWSTAWVTSSSPAERDHQHCGPPGDPQGSQGARRALWRLGPADTPPLVSVLSAIFFFRRISLEILASDWLEWLLWLVRVWVRPKPNHKPNHKHNLNHNPKPNPKV